MIMAYEMVMPVIAGASGVFAGCAVLYSKIRPRFPVSVNCWFCNKDTKVEFRHKEGWMCPSCEQYNGFTEDGDYNRDLPAQYCSSLNSPVGCQMAKKPQTQPSLALGNGFCQTCNLNQTLKVRALADYTPIDPDNYDQEIEDYRKRLERVYALCRQCEATLHQTLGKQDSWLKPKLISWRLMLSSQNKAQIYATVKNSASRIPAYLLIFHLIGVIISLALFLCNLHHLQQDSGKKVVSLDFGMDMEVYLSTLYKFVSPLIIIGLTLVLIVIFCSGKEALLVSDAIASFIWVGLLALTSSKQLISKKDYNPLQVLLSGAAVIFTLWTTFVPRTSNSTKTKNKPPLNKSMMSNTSSACLEDSQCTLNASLTDDLNNITPPSTSRPNDVTSTPIPQMNFQPKESVDLDSTMGSLKISNPAKNDCRIQPNTPFSPKALFSEKPGYNPRLNDTYCSQQAPMSPSRLSTKNITQSSWVAGGYWGHPVSPTREFSQHKAPTLGMMQHGQTNLYPLSRSSSQSSGFVSHSSGLPSFNSQMPCSLPNSLHGSLCGDADRVSVLSEPAYKPWGYPGSMYASDTASQYSFARQRGPGKSDAQSLYSCVSALSERSHGRGPPSPTASTTYLFQDALGNLSENSSNSSSTRNTTKVRKADTTVMDVQKRNGSRPKQMLNYRNPWIAFFLGMSIAANCFFAILLFGRADVHSLIST